MKVKKEKLRIFIVDDHEFFRKGIALSIKNFPFAKVVGEASNGFDFIKMMDKTPADIVLMDIKMPKMNGIDATKQALNKNPNLKIIALSMFGDEQYLQSMIDAGAVGFMLKNIKTHDLERALILLSEGKQYFSEELLIFLTKRYSSPKKMISNFEKLTKRETEILKVIAEGLSNQQIADELFISIRTVTNHRSNIYDKLNVHNTAQLIAFAHEHKLLP
jgi:DNA-binding NarL/FixJ family response regulator